MCIIKISRKEYPGSFCKFRRDPSKVQETHAHGIHAVACVIRQAQRSDHISLIREPFAPHFRVRRKSVQVLPQQCLKRWVTGQSHDLRKPSCEQYIFSSVATGPPWPRHVEQFAPKKFNVFNVRVEVVNIAKVAAVIPPNMCLLAFPLAWLPALGIPQTIAHWAQHAETKASSSTSRQAKLCHLSVGKVRLDCLRRGYASWSRKTPARSFDVILRQT